MTRTNLKQSLGFGVVRFLGFCASTTCIEKVRFLPMSALICILSGCVMGIPSANNTFTHKEPVPCTPIIVDGVERACLPPEAMARWVRRNIP